MEIAARQEAFEALSVNLTVELINCLNVYELCNKGLSSIVAKSMVKLFDALAKDGGAKLDVSVAILHKHIDDSVIKLRKESH